MTLYNTFINNISQLLQPQSKKLEASKSISRGNKNDILLLKDTAYELGGSQQTCVCTTAVTSTMQFDNGVYLVGRDLCQIKKDCTFGKIVFIQTAEFDDDDTAFDTIKELEGMCYRFSAEGFMSRSSALNMREQIRVSKKAIKRKLSFGDYGKALVDEYLNNPAVKSVQIYFVTDFDGYDELIRNAHKIKETTSALNHILDNILFDCSTCNLKGLCDEVEGMKELHMKQQKQ